MQGWDLLLRAFLSAFTAEDNVLLLLSTKPYHGKADFDRQMQASGCIPLAPPAVAHACLPMTASTAHPCENCCSAGPEPSWARRRGTRSPSCPRSIPQRQFPRLYKSAHCFVLPTRWVGGGGGGGSGWMFRPAVVPMQSPGALPCLADEPRRPVPGTGLQGRGLGAARGGGDVDGAARDCGEWGPSADEQTSAEQVDRWRPSSAVVWRMRAHDLPRSG